MSTIRALVPYQTDTFRRFPGQSPSQHGETFHRRPEASRNAAPGQPQQAPPTPPQRQSAFLVQLLVQGNPDLRKALGRRDLADRREAAYGEALASRPSARPASAPRVIGSA